MRVGIALGSNLGDRIRHLRAAVAAIREFAEDPVLVSRVYETEPVGCPPGSPAFLNGAVEIGYSGKLLELLTYLQRIENAQGRRRIREQNSPRPVDLDILYADDLEVVELGLTVPHPRLATRAFVLLPLNDIAPQRVLPGFRKTVSEHLHLSKKDECKLTEYFMSQ